MSEYASTTNEQLEQIRALLAGGTSSGGGADSYNPSHLRIGVIVDNTASANENNFTAWVQNTMTANDKIISTSSYGIVTSNDSVITVEHYIIVLWYKDPAV